MSLSTTPLDALHRKLGARMAPFAGYDMPVQYPAGIMAEHLACRAGAGLFDVSHMGQATLRGAGAAAYLESLMPGDILGLAPGRQRYSFLTTATGGISDDLMVACTGPDSYALVVNASRKADDYALLAEHLPAGLVLDVHEDRALIALQGPGAAAMLPLLADMAFMDVRDTAIAGVACTASRSGYTGEDGWEIGCPADGAQAVAAALLGAGAVPVGLGARDSLRLEAGLCLYGNDIGLATTPVEAALTWAIGKRRRREGGYPGAGIVRDQLLAGPARRRVGILPEGRAPARAGTPVLDDAGTAVGSITSGGYGPSIGGPVAMGYVPAALAAPGTALRLLVRDRALPARVVQLPFVPHRYHR